ncbi:MAG: tetratricopeptide repeat protein [Nitrospirota bacterium]|nr:tetratricopeptide repeat protein [Nitrospirota bacterium]
MNRASRRQTAKSSPTSRTQSLSPEAHRLFQEAVSHHQAKRFQQAEAGYDHILSQFPTHPDSLHLRGLLGYQQGHYQLALELIQEAISLDHSKPHYFFNQALVLEKKERWDEAISAYQEAIRLKPQYVEALSNIGNVYRQQRQWPKAIAAYEDATRLRPQSADLLNNLGVVYKEKGDLDHALTHYQQATQLSPEHAEAHHNMGVVLKDQGKLEEAAHAFQHALNLKPTYANAHYHLGLIFLWQQRKEDALACFQRSADLTYNQGQGVAPPFVTKARLKHDAEQLDYLSAHVPSIPFPQDYQDTLKATSANRTQEISDSIFVQLTLQEQKCLAPSFHKLLYVRPTDVVSGKAINPDLDVAAIEAQYYSTQPETMFVDNLLTQEALTELRAFCLESTIWKRDYPNGYIGTFLANGFACPLLLQIAEELRTRFPRLFQHHQLVQAWAFKYDSALRGLNMHADAAAVNVNFWITPNEANRNSGNGGLVVWDKEAPNHWDFAEYNNDKNRYKIQEFLEQSEAKPITIPHRQNRAVIFNSNLFHKTDVIDFQDKYESRRINVTLLYGHRQQSRQL